MSVSTELERIQTARNTIRTKMVELGLAESTDTLDMLAEDVEGITNRGAVAANVKEGETYTIPKGYHNGGGTVSGVAGGGNYSLQQKTVTPTKAQQEVNEDSGYYGLSSVIVKAIPENYQDVSSVTAGAADVLATKVIVDATGKVTTGTMPNNGAVSKTLDTATTSYAVPKGYHSGTGTVSITTETKTATPTKATQSITPTSGKVLSKVTVNPIPDEYQDVSGVTATADKVLRGSVFVDAEGTEVEGTMPDNEPTNIGLGLGNGSYIIPEGYHDGTGSVGVNVQHKDMFITGEVLQGITITPDSGFYLGAVNLRPVTNSGVADTSSATATAGDILSGKTAYVKGSKVTGTMANNGAVSKTIDGMTTTSVVIPAGYTTGGTVSLTTAIEEALAAI